MTICRDTCASKKSEKRQQDFYGTVKITSAKTKIVKNNRLSFFNWFSCLKELRKKSKDEQDFNGTKNHFCEDKNWQE